MRVCCHFEIRKTQWAEKDDSITCDTSRKLHQPLGKTNLNSKKEENGQQHTLSSNCHCFNQNIDHFPLKKKIIRTKNPNLKRRDPFTKAVQAALMTAGQRSSDLQHTLAVTEEHAASVTLWGLFFSLSLCSIVAQLRPQQWRRQQPAHFWKQMSCWKGRAF